MTIFTIDHENNLAIHTRTPTLADVIVALTNEKELASVTRDWPLTRLAEIWNKFAGATLFDDLKPVRQFPNRKTAIAKIWRAAQRLSEDSATMQGIQPCRRQSKLPSTAKHTRAKDGRPKKMEVIALMKRSKGATLAEIMQATGWQKHTVRGFVSLLGRKGEQKVESSKNFAGERAYRIAK